VSDPRAIVGLVEQERMRNEEMARREQEVSEHTTADEREVIKASLAYPRMVEPDILVDFMRRLLAERDALAKRLDGSLCECGGEARSDIQCPYCRCDEQAKRVAELEAENANLLEQKAQLIIQAQSHALEARAQRATVHEVNQAVSGATGEKGDWNGAIPVIERIAELTARAEKAEAKAKELDGLRFTHERACRDYAVRVLEEIAASLSCTQYAKDGEEQSASAHEAEFFDRMEANILRRTADRIRKGEV
jgi:hypothetical protein